MHARSKKIVCVFKKSSVKVLRSSWAAALRIILLLAALAVLCTCFLILSWVRPLWGQRFFPWMYRQLFLLAGLRLKEEGAHDPKASFFVSNHLSFFDILLLGSVVPASFLSKKEVAKWPFVGRVAKKTGTFFVTRKKQDLKKEIALLQKRIQDKLEGKGSGLILFLEGTSGDGVHLLTFKSSLLASLDRLNKDNLFIQPVSLVLDRLNGLKMSAFFKKMYSYRGDVSLFQSMWWILKMGVIDLRLVYHKSVAVSEFESRADLAKALWCEVAKPLSEPLYREAS